MRPRALALRVAAALVPVFLLALWLAGAAPQKAPQKSPAAKAPAGHTARKVTSGEAAWREVYRLIDEDKPEEAARKVAAIRAAARAAGREREWTLALVQEAQLRVRNAPEAAILLLRDEPWPENDLDRAILHLYLGQAVDGYYTSRSWSINRREQIGAPRTLKDLDLGTATQAEMFAAMTSEYLEVWRRREALSAVSVQSLVRYVLPSDYPPDVRGTARDMVSYLFAANLADSTFWSPRESNELFRLDLARLIEGQPGSTADPADATAHPLARMASVLGDLETWHRAAGHRAAALEARLERLRLLHTAFTEEKDRALLRRSLEESLPAFRGTPWWSMGMATLADFVRGEQGPGHLARADRIARDGEAAAPKSPGGFRCRSIARSIEAPDFELTTMKSDAPDRRSIRVRHKNLGALWFRLYAIDPLRQAGKPRAGLLLYPEEKDLAALVQTTTPEAIWRTELPPTPDFELHTTYVVPPVQRHGAYLVVASARADFAKQENRRMAAAILLGDLVVQSQLSGGAFEIAALSGEDGHPVSGAEVRLYTGDWDGGRLLQTGTTGADGRVRMAVSGSASGYFALARHGEDFALLDSLWAWSPSSPPEDNGATLLYTDRAVYRPGQKIFWKALAYRRKDPLSPPVLAPDTEVTVTLVDLNRQAVSAKTVRTNGFGTASGEIEIPPGRPLGSWSLQAAPQGWAAVRVEEYKRPTFEVTLKDSRGALRLNQPARFEGGARYYFGLPVVNGKVRWRAYREAVMPDWWLFWNTQGSTKDQSDQVVAAGTAELSAEGSFEIAFTPEADPNAKAGVTFRYRIEAEVTDEGGETREAKRSFRLGRTSVEARIEPAADLFVAGRSAHVKIVRTNLDGVALPGTGTWTLVALRQPERALAPADQPWPGPVDDNVFRTPGDALRPRDAPAYKPDEILRGWPDGARMGGGTLEHGKDGTVDLELPANLPAGAYRLRYETPDEMAKAAGPDTGGLAVATRELIVAGPRTPLALPAVLKLDRSEAHVGGTLRLLAGSGLSGQTATLEIYQDGKVIGQRALAADGAPSLIEIPLGEEHQGGFTLRLWAVRDHQIMDLSESAFVPWDRGLDIKLSTFRDRVRPGSHETWRVTVHRAGTSEAAAAEILAYLYDRSLDQIERQNPPQVLALFPWRTQTNAVQMSLGGRFASALPSTNWREAARMPEMFRPDRLRLALGRFHDDPWTVLTTTSGLVMDRISFDGVKRPQPMPPAVRRRLGLGRGVPGGVLGFVEGGVAGGVPGGVVGGTPGAMPAPPPPPPQPASPPPPITPPETPRSDFAETALWAPHLLTGADGSATIEVDFPDSVTSWNFYLHAVTRDLRSASTLNQVESVKDLMVRPYLPRFLREGDQAVLKAVVNNASRTELHGQVDFDLVDPETGKSRLTDFGLDDAKARLPFTVAPGGGASLTFPVTVPKQIGSVAVRVTASAGDLSDGELRPVPILPSRLHLAQSRFVALRGPGHDRREMTFPDLANGGDLRDPTRVDEQMVVTLDGQLFSGVLQALPYLRRYPYECTEQTLNRFLSTAIVASVFDRYPAIAKAAREMAARDTRYETWDAADPNRKMSLEETPWLQEEQGGERGDDQDSQLLRVLDPRIARAEKASALARLEKSQLADGSFPWWPGGPPSPYMTAYTLYGFAKAREHGVDVPRTVVQKAWKYLGDNFRAYDHAELKTRTCCWDGLVLLNYVVTAFPDPAWTVGGPTLDERRAILDATFRNRQSLPPYLKAMLALTLKRMGRAADGRLVLDGLLDAAKTTPDEGTFWAAEERSWLWYNDTIESHAMILRALTELRPGDPRADGIVQWLFLNKKLNHWKSTRATAEVIYALVHHLEKENQLGRRETATVHLGVHLGQRTETYTFEPDSFAARKAQLVVPGNEIDPATSSTIVVEKETPGFLFASATWHFATDELPKEERGDLFGVARHYFRRVKTDRDTVLQPLAEGDLLHPGDEVEIHLTIRSKAPAEYVHLRDPRPAGLEPGPAVSGYHFDLGLIWYEETRDSGTNFFFENLPQGEYTLKYRLRANLAGTFRTGPATLQSMYAPEFTAYSPGAVVRVGE